LLEEFDYQNETLMVAPAAGFYSTEGKGNNQVRIAYVLNQDSLKRAIKCLEEALIQYPGLKR
jgi:aspartate aminotransferase